MSTASDLREETQFVQNLIAKEKALGRKLSPQAATSAFRKAKRQKAAGGASVKPPGRGVPGLLTRAVRTIRGV